MKRLYAAVCFLAVAVPVALTGGAAVPGVAAAQDAPATPASDAAEKILKTEYPKETMDLAETLVKVSGTSRTFDVILPNVADETKNLFIKANPQMQLGVISIVDRLALGMVPRRSELDQALAKVWASGFTPEEMQQLVTFFESDVGKKFAGVHPKLLTVEMATAQQWGLSVGKELTQKVAAELKTAIAADQRAQEGDIAGPAKNTAASGAAPAEAPAN